MERAILIRMDWKAFFFIMPSPFLLSLVHSFPSTTSSWKEIGSVSNKDGMEMMAMTGR